jgi:hypothetical protein
MIDKIKAVVEQLNILEAERLKSEGYTNECFFDSEGKITQEYSVKLREKKKYFYIDFGSSGAFMIAKEKIRGYEQGSIFNIKGYGTPDFNKYLGNIQDIDVKLLHSKRWNYLK